MPGVMRTVNSVRRIVSAALLIFLGVGASRTEAVGPRADVVTRVRTTENVVFITIDDGFHRSKEAAAALDRTGWPVSNFVLPSVLGGTKTKYFGTLGTKAEFGNHTMHHAKLKGRSLKFQRGEICSARKALQRKIGDHTTMFRPPFGAFDDTTLRAAAECGMTHVVMWRVTVYQDKISTWGGPIKRGDVILLHHIQSLGESIDVLSRELKRRGLRPALLSEYLK